MKRLRMTTALTGLLAGALFAQPALAADEERPQCPTGTVDGWDYMYDEDKIRLEQQDVTVTWLLEDGATATTKGYAVSYYWTGWYEGIRETMRDGEDKLQVGLFFRPPRVDGISMGPGFATGDDGREHDHYQQLSHSGNVLIPIDEDWEDTWKPDGDPSIFMGTSYVEGGQEMKDVVDNGGTLTVELWFRNEYWTAGEKLKVATGTIDVAPAGRAFDALHADRVAEQARAKSTNVYCVESKF